MSPGTQKILKLYSSNKEEWDYLDKVVSREILPVRYGGTVGRH